MMISRLCVGPLQTNCYIVAAEGGSDGVVIDPGGDADVILGELRRLGVSCRHILLTHAHGDHIAALDQVKGGTGGQVCVHRADAGMLRSPMLNLLAWTGSSVTVPAADRLVEAGDVITIGSGDAEVALRVAHTPGHTPGGCCFVTTGHIFTGDLLFAGSIGRCDLPGGDEQQMMESLRAAILPLPDDMIVHPGHGPETTIGREKAGNPFLVSLLAGTGEG